MTSDPLAWIVGITCAVVLWQVQRIKNELRDLYWRIDQALPLRDDDDEEV